MHDHLTIRCCYEESNLRKWVNIFPTFILLYVKSNCFGCIWANIPMILDGKIFMPVVIVLAFNQKESSIYFHSFLTKVSFRGRCYGRSFNKTSLGWITYVLILVEKRLQNLINQIESWKIQLGIYTGII